MAWILGWDIYLNARNIWWIKEDIHVLQDQNELQENQILELAQFLNLTMVQVTVHQIMLHELDTRLLIMNKTLAKTLRAVTNLKYMVAILTDIQTAPNWLTLGILGLKENVDFILESMPSCWNKANQLILTWQALDDLHAKATSSGLRVMLRLNNKIGTTYQDGAAVQGRVGRIWEGWKEVGVFRHPNLNPYKKCTCAPPWIGDEELGGFGNLGKW